MIPPKIKSTFAFREKCNTLHPEPLHVQINTFRQVEQWKVAPRPCHSHSSCNTVYQEDELILAFPTVLALLTSKEKQRCLGQHSCSKGSNPQALFDLGQITDSHSPSGLPLRNLNKNITYVIGLL